MGQQLAIGRLRDDPLGIIVLAIRKQDTLWGRESYGIRYGIRRELATRAVCRGPSCPRSRAGPSTRRCWRWRPWASTCAGAGRTP